MCALEGRRDVSLGLIKPSDYSLNFEDDPGTWSPDQRRKLMGGQAAIDLFGELRSPKGLLEKLPVKVRYRFRCPGPDCNGHEKLFEDWEVGESWRSWNYPSRAALEAAVVNRFADVPRRHDNLFLFVGTMAAHPESWIVIGHAQPLHLRRAAEIQGAPA